MESDSSDTTSTTKTNLAFITSNKGKKLLVYKNYIFRCNKTTIFKKYWVCNERNCGVFVHTSSKDEFISIVGEHNHIVEPHFLDIRSVKEKMKERIFGETTSITKIYDEEVKKASLSAEAAAELPTVIEFRTLCESNVNELKQLSFLLQLGSNMSKARRKKTPVVPSSCVFEIPKTYQQTISNQRFLLCDFFVKRAKERVLFFSTDQQLHLLFSSTVIFVDGTFSTAPNNFEQVFLIHIQWCNQGKQTRNVNIF